MLFSTFAVAVNVAFAAAAIVGDVNVDATNAAATAYSCCRDGYNSIMRRILNMNSLLKFYALHFKSKQNETAAATTN